MDLEWRNCWYLTFVVDFSPTIQSLSLLYWYFHLKFSIFTAHAVCNIICNSERSEGADSETMLDYCDVRDMGLRKIVVELDPEAQELPSETLGFTRGEVRYHESTCWFWFMRKRALGLFRSNYQKHSDVRNAKYLERAQVLRQFIPVRLHFSTGQVTYISHSLTSLP